MGRIGVAAVLALAGCADPGGGLGGLGGGGNLPEVTMTAEQEWIVPPGRQQTGLAVRAFVPGADGWEEVAGARCRVSGGVFYHADLVTPARLVLPDLGPDAPALTADCASGAARGRAAVAPAYGWAQTGGNWPQRVGFGGGWWRGYEASGPLRYPELAVGMRVENATAGR